MEIVVADTGGGIPEENLGKLFNPFFTTKPLGKGTGLGLSIVYGIIKMHRGQISVKSQLGKGTTFTITLPIRLLKTGTDIAKTEPASSDRMGSFVMKTKGKILVISSNPDLQNACRQALKPGFFFRPNRRLAP